ncbi:SRPBCC family protein [Pararcticibacter amylolyticus]|uniref:Tungsten formylmethanofuran dehydrogenase n=1 Tax=Pararcticibacter amylolyticus TaxID=2173175 RepID=A0A2U2PKP9_9SPHI|nr:SRPBCC domain-containing protein [Pararcticibacter amylolyticus]PWG81983.1 tungsten formylmethanofuran dehydrogenase [Pararcticibacter amylolyticus]
MERQQFKIEINAPAAKVYNTMLGEETYKKWTAVFMPSSYYEGSWEKGQKILFIAVGKDGKREGMMGVIEENIPDKYVSIKYTGIVDGDKEITEGSLVGDWIGAYEIYSFEEQDGKTTLIIDVDVLDEYKEYFEKTYPKALEKLKEISE